MDFQPENRIQTPPQTRFAFGVARANVDAEKDHGADSGAIMCWPRPHGGQTSCPSSIPTTKLSGPKCWDKSLGQAPEMRGFLCSSWEVKDGLDSRGSGSQAL